MALLFTLTFMSKLLAIEPSPFFMHIIFCLQLVWLYFSSMYTHILNTNFYCFFYNSLQKMRYGMSNLPVTYRVSHIEVCKVNQLWGIEESIVLLNHDAQWVQEVWKFEFYQPVFKKVTKAGLNSLRQKEYQISVKNWIFNDPFKKKGLVLVIWVLGIIQPSS